MSDMDELVEKAKDAMFDILYDLGGSDSTKADEPLARAALEAVGLPALLERVEAAEENAEDLCRTVEAAIAERDALAAKVARVEAVLDKWDVYDAEGYAAGDGPDPYARIEELRAEIAGGPTDGPE